MTYFIHLQKNKNFKTCYSAVFGLIYLGGLLPENPCVAGSSPAHTTN